MPADFPDQQALKPSFSPLYNPTFDPCCDCTSGNFIYNKSTPAQAYILCLLESFVSKNSLSDVGGRSMDRIDSLIFSVSVYSHREQMS